MSEQDLNTLVQFFKALCENNGAEVIILNRPIQLEPEQELVEDVLAVITVMSARLYGRRSKRNLKAMQAMHECAEKIVSIED